MASNKRKTSALKLPTQEIDDRGIVRLGAGIITADFPLPRHPDEAAPVTKAGKPGSQ
jgi:hypothetical protein